MKFHHYQKGVGLIEVLVALLLLAVGVLGYSILQIRAVDASSEALSRSQGMLITRALAENMRANPGAQTNYPTAVRGFTNITAAPTVPRTTHLPKEDRTLRSHSSRRSTGNRVGTSRPTQARWVDRVA